MYTPAKTYDEALNRLRNLDEGRPSRWPPLNAEYSVWKYLRSLVVAEVAEFEVEALREAMVVRPQVFSGAERKTVEEVGIVGDHVRPHQVFVRFTDGTELRVRAHRDGTGGSAYLEIAALPD